MGKLLCEKHQYEPKGRIFTDLWNELSDENHLDLCYNDKNKRVYIQNFKVKRRILF